MVPLRAFDESLGECKNRLAYPSLLEGFNSGGAELTADGLVVLKVTCGEGVFDRSMDLFAEDSEEVVYVVVEYFVDDHRLYLGVGWHAKCCDLGLNELIDIRLIRALLVGLVVIGIRLVPELGSGFGFCNFLVELDLRRTMLDHR